MQQCGITSYLPPAAAVAVVRVWLLIASQLILRGLLVLLFAVLLGNVRSLVGYWLLGTSGYLVAVLSRLSWTQIGTTSQVQQLLTGACLVQVPRTLWHVR